MLNTFEDSLTHFFSFENSLFKSVAQFLTGSFVFLIIYYLCSLSILNINLPTIFLFVFQDRVFMCSPGCPETHSGDQAGLKLRDFPASAS